MKSPSKYEFNLSRICNFGSRPLSLEQNPFYLSLKYYLENGEIESASRILYEELQRLNQDQTFGAVYGLPSSLFGDTSSEKSFVPWLNKAPSKKYHQTLLKCPTEDYCTEKLKKLASLYLSISQRGYEPGTYAKDHRYQQIVGYHIVFNNEKRFWLTAGNHRAVVLGLLGRKTCLYDTENARKSKQRDFASNVYLDSESFLINFFRRKTTIGESICIPPVIDLTNVTQWPAVISGYLTANEAVRVAENFFMVDQILDI